MNLTEYTYLLNRPDAVTDKHTADLEKIVSEFPFFQSARALRLKGLYNQNSFQYNYALKVTAAYTTERGVLFDFITSDTFTAIHKGLYEQKLAELYNIEVTGSKVVDQTEALEPAVDKIEQSILTSIKESEIPYEEPPVILEQVLRNRPLSLLQIPLKYLIQRLSLPNVLGSKDPIIDLGHSHQ